MWLTVYLIPCIFIIVFIIAKGKKVKVYDSFAEGVKGAIPLVFSIFPFIATIMLMMELFEVSGLSSKMITFLTPACSFLGIPKEIVKLVILKPFSGSGSTALLVEVFSVYGADSYIARCACICYGASETIFYVSAVYFSTVKEKKLFVPILVALLCSLFATTLGCFLCRFI